MTRKQLKKYASELAKLELEHQEGKDKRQTEKRIMEITNIVADDSYGMEHLAELDEMVQELLQNKIV